jgi:predicted MPP superfamily phosphohydrolase
LHTNAFNAVQANPSTEAPERCPRVRYIRPRRGPRLQVRSLRGFEWNTLELRIDDMPPALEGLRLWHLTDLHLRRRWRPQLDEIIQRGRSDPPDLMLFTGDFVDDKRDHRAALPLVQRLVTQLRATFGTFAVLGNHDGDLLGPRLMGWGVKLLTHRRAEVSVRGAMIELLGLPGVDRIDLDENFIRTAPPRKPGVPRIILSHYPDLIRAATDLRADLFLAGHTHGGQMCLPNERAILTHDSLPRRLCKGAHDVDGTCLLVGRGFGFTTIPVRLFCPAELVEVVLRK